MNNNQFLLSIIIPTKNRQPYAVKAVEQILSINKDNIQVVIQDNSDDESLFEMLSAYANDKRLKYQYSSGIISFVDNFNLAVEISDGEYLCLIGDDDGIIPQVMDVTEWASKNNIDAVKPGLNAVYFWPNSGALRNRADNGYFNINKITVQAKICNPMKEVVKLLNKGGQNYLSLNLAKLYHGIVRKECLENIKRQTGKYFGGLSPDIYLAVALSLTVDAIVQIDFPLTISGICSKSGSADSVTGRHTGKLEDAPHFRGYDKYKWSDLVPRFYSVETIWADSALAAIKDLNKQELFEEFNVAALAAYCINRYPQFKDDIMRHYENTPLIGGNSKIRILLAYIQNPVIDFIKKVIHRLLASKDIKRINGVENIECAVDILQERLDGLGINIEYVLSSLETTIKK